MSDDNDNHESKNHPAGAREKIRRARMLRDGEDPEIVHGKRGGGESSDAVPALVAVYGLSVGLALLLTQGVLSKGIPFHLPDTTLDRWLLGSPVPAVTGNPDTDMLITVFVRGMAIFLLAGVIPLFTKILHRLLNQQQDKPPRFVVFWIVSVIVAALIYLSFRHNL